MPESFNVMLQHKLVQRYSTCGPCDFKTMTFTGRDSVEPFIDLSQVRCHMELNEAETRL